MTASRETTQVGVILAFIAAGFAFHFAFNDGLKTESSSPAAAASPTVSKKLEHARSLQQVAIRLNQQRFVALKERKAQRARVTRARARAARAFAAAKTPSPTRTSSAPRASTPAPAPARSAPAPASPAPKPAPSGGGGGSKGGSFDDSG
jgi:hypothetical protein